MAAKVILESNADEWLFVEQKRLETALERMAWAIIADARMTVPRKTGNLANTGRVNGSGTKREASFGGFGVKYAHAQEMGTNGIVVFRHYTTPGTGPHYLEKAGDNRVKKGLKPYL